MGFGGGGNSDRWHQSGSTTSIALSLAQDGDFAGCGNVANTYTGSESQRDTPFCRDAIIEHMGYFFASNNFTVGSIGKFTLAIETVLSTIFVIDNIDENTPQGYIFVEGKQIILQGERVAVKWNSDSAGATGLRGQALGGRWA